MVHRALPHLEDEQLRSRTHFDHARRLREDHSRTMFAAILLEIGQRCCKILM